MGLVLSPLIAMVQMQTMLALNQWGKLTPQTEESISLFYHHLLNPCNYITWRSSVGVRMFPV